MPGNSVHLADVIDYQKDIEPYRFIEIHSGVGSGKNTLIEAFAKGEVLNAPRMRVLLITSRRAKVDETFTKYDIFDNKSLNLFKDKIGKAWDIVNGNGQHDLVTVGNTVCTAAFIAGYLRYVYREDDIRTHLWEMYDLIAIDEAHSIILDATYQDPPFHVFELISHYLERCIHEKYPIPLCKHLILMTGTPDPLATYFPIEKVPVVCIDKMAECENVQPNNIHFTESQNVIQLLSQLIQNGKRCIYFANRIERVIELSRNSALPKDKIVVSFSNEEKRRTLLENDEQAWNDMLETEKSIKADYQIPNQFSVLFTTSRYREGINIEDNIDTMIVESHNKSDVLQMAGRVRSGVNDLYIVVNAPPYPTDETKEIMEQNLARIQLFGSTDPTIPRIKDSEGKIDRRCYPLNYMLNEIETEQLQKFIALVEDKFPYVRYSYLYESFMLYVPRITGIKYNQDQNKIWSAATDNRKLPYLVGTWFSNAEVDDYQSERERKYDASWDAWRRYEFVLDETYPKERISEFKAELSQIWGYSQMKKLMPLFSNYECIRAGHGNKSFKFREIKK